MMKHGGVMSFVDQITEKTMVQHTRRGFLYGLGKAGLMLITVGTGLDMATGSVRACPPGQCGCPYPCTGVCSATYSDCITGGRACTIVCPCGCCLPAKCEAHGYWLLEYGECNFYCDCYPC